MTHFTRYGFRSIYLVLLVWWNCLCITDFYLLGCWSLVQPKKRVVVSNSVFKMDVFFVREEREVCRITSSLFLSTPGGELRSFIPGILCFYAHMKAETKVDKQASKVHSHLLLVDSHPHCVFLGQRWTTSLPCQHLCVRVDLYLLMYASHRAGGEVWWVIFDKYSKNDLIFEIEYWEKVN